MPLRFPLRSKAQGPSSTGAVQVWVGARPGPWRWLGRVLLVSAGLGVGLLLLGLSFRLGLRLMLDPEALPQVLAQGQRSQPLTLAPAASLDDLRQQAAAAEQQLGAPLWLEEADGLVLVPVIEADGGAVVSLVLFHRAGAAEDLAAIATLTIDALPKETVLAPFRNGSQAPAAAPQTFSLTRVRRLPAPPVATGSTWLTLEGTWQQQGLTLRYGQLLHVDWQSQRLALLEPWSSPANRPPQWADLDGDGPSDLVIDETVGLEPALRGWQVIAGATPRLQPVSWLRVPVDARGQAGDYQQALRLARGGLWSAAQDQLVILKLALSQDWNPAAEAQLRLIERHATITRQQADQDWSTPTQQILTRLIDGRWEAALTQLESSPELVPEVSHRLGADQGQMWNRISAAAALPDALPAVYVWGGLALKARQKQSINLEGATQDWLDRQPVSTAARQRLTQMLALATPSPPPSPSRNSAAGDGTRAIAAADRETIPAIAPPDAFVGQATAIPVPPAGYAAPGQSLDAALGQWYAIDLRAVRQNQVWQRGSLVLPPTATPAAAWPVVQPAAQALPQILRWVSPTTGRPAPLTVRGLTLNNGRPTLLATGPKTGPEKGPETGPEVLPPLVFSQGALLWLDASQGQRPAAGDMVDAIAAAIFGNQLPPPDFANVLVNLAQHSIDLIGDGQLERVLTWDDSALAQLRQWQVPVIGAGPKTIILSRASTVIYSDIAVPQTLVAFTNPTMGQPVRLLVHRAEGYELVFINELEAY